MPFWASKEGSNEYKYEVHLYYGGKDGSRVYIGKPIIYKETDDGGIKKQMYPNEARLRNLSYASHIFFDLDIEYIIRIDGKEEKVEKTFEKVF